MNSAEPKNAQQFLALRPGPEEGKPLGCYFASDDTIISLVDGEGVGWQLGKYLDGDWFRQRRS